MKDINSADTNDQRDEMETKIISENPGLGSRNNLRTAGRETVPPQELHCTTSLHFLRIGFSANCLDLCPGGILKATTAITDFRVRSSTEGQAGCERLQSSKQRNAERKQEKALGSQKSEDLWKTNAAASRHPARAVEPA